jgi:hypothetical protein
MEASSNEPYSKTTLTSLPTKLNKLPRFPPAHYLYFQEKNISSQPDPSNFQKTRSQFSSTNSLKSAVMLCREYAFHNLTLVPSRRNSSTQFHALSRENRRWEVKRHNLTLFLSFRFERFLLQVKCMVGFVSLERFLGLKCLLIKIGERLRRRFRSNSFAEFQLQSYECMFWQIIK